MKPDNKGFTLIELILAVTISIILLGMVATLIWQSSNYYRKSNEEIILQMEAQTILNQLKEIIGEADNVSYDNTAEPAVLKIQHGKNLLYEIIFNSSSYTLTFVKAEKAADGSISRTQPQLFGKYVNALNIINELNTGKISISFILKGNSSSYEVDNSIITLRNDIKPMEPYW